METKKLRVNPKCPLPHIVNIRGINYTFMPDCEVPKEWAEEVLKNPTKTFSESKGEPDLHLYSWKPAFIGKSFASMYEKLSDEDKGKAWKFVEDLAKAKEAKEKKLTADKEKEDLDKAKADKQAELDARKAREKEKEIKKAQAKESEKKGENITPTA